MKAILKGVEVVIVTLFLLAVMLPKAHAFTPDDLDGAILQEQGVCVYNETPVSCAVYELKGEKFVLYATREGVFAVYLVRKGATMPYGMKDQQLLWMKKKGIQV